MAVQDSRVVPEWVWPLIIGNVLTAMTTYAAIRADLATVMERTTAHDRRIEQLDGRIRDLERPVKPQSLQPSKDHKMLDNRPLT